MSQGYLVMVLQRMLVDREFRHRLTHDPGVILSEYDLTLEETDIITHAAATGVDHILFEDLEMRMAEMGISLNGLAEPAYQPDLAERLMNEWNTKMK